MRGNTLREYRRVRWPQQGVDTYVTLKVVDLNESLINSTTKDVGRCLEFLRTLDKRLVANGMSDNLSLFLVAVLLCESWLEKKWTERFGTASASIANLKVNDFRDGILI